MLNQTQLVQFASEDKKINTLCETDVALGDFHDYLMKLKGYVVDRMVAAQKEEQAMADAQKEPCESECSDK